MYEEIREMIVRDWEELRKYINTLPPEQRREAWNYVLTLLPCRRVWPELEGSQNPTSGGGVKSLDSYSGRYKKWQEDVTKMMKVERGSNPHQAQVPTLVEYQRRLIRLMTELEAL